MNVSAVNRLIESVFVRDSRLIELAEAALDDLYSLTAAEDKYFISEDPDYDRQFRQTNADFNARIEELNRFADTSTKTALLSDISKNKARYDTLAGKPGVNASRGKVRKGMRRAYVIERDRMVRGMDQNIRDLLRISTKDRNLKLKQSHERSARVTDMIILAEFIAFILVIVITYINARQINRPIKLLGEKTREVANGKFLAPLNISSPPEIGELADAFNQMCDRLRELDQMKIDYISHLSHELRTPLTVIREASGMLQEGVFSQFPEKQAELFSLIEAECERLIASVSRILDFSRMEAGDMFFNFQQADLHPIMEKSVLKLAPLTLAKKTGIVLHAPPDIPLLRMDVEKIEEVLENLLGNALKYTPEEGHITVSARNNQEDQTVEVSVADNGRGIPEDGLQEVFEKFKRVDDGRGVVRGTGLGLAIVKHIINAHGGHIWVESKIGEGSTFTFTLPASSACSL